MIIPGPLIYDKNIVSYLLDSNYQIDQAGVCFTLNKVYLFKGKGTIDFDESFKELAQLKEIPFNDDFSIYLQKGVYYIEFNEWITLPENVVGIFINDKDLIRNGVVINSALLQFNFSGKVGALMSVLNPEGVKFIKHARLGKWVFLTVGDLNLNEVI